MLKKGSSGKMRLTCKHRLVRVLSAREGSLAIGAPRSHICCLPHQTPGRPQMASLVAWVSLCWPCLAHYQACKRSHSYPGRIRILFGISQLQSRFRARRYSWKSETNRAGGDWLALSSRRQACVMHLERIGYHRLAICLNLLTLWTLCNLLHWISGLLRCLIQAW